MKEKVTEATVHVLSSALAGGAAHALHGYFPAERKSGVGNDARRALIHALLSVGTTVAASAIVRRAL